MPLLDKATVPTWYEKEYTRLARAGRRVIALAHRNLGPSALEGRLSSLRILLICRFRNVRWLRVLFLGCLIEFAEDAGSVILSVASLFKDIW